MNLSWTEVCGVGVCACVHLVLVCVCVCVSVCTGSRQQWVFESLWEMMNRRCSGQGRFLRLAALIMEAQLAVFIATMEGGGRPGSVNGR